MADSTASGRRRALINYRGSLADGTVFDDNEKGEPLEVVIGGHSVPEPLDEALGEMKIGEERVVYVPAARGYGEYDRSAVQRVQRSSIPNGDQLREGMSVHWTFPKSAGRAVPATVVEAGEWSVELDFNHPLAGKDLVYWIRLVDLPD